MAGDDRTEIIVPKIVRNEAFYAFARLCMILAIPIGGFFMNRLIAKADQISEQVAAQQVDLKILAHRVEFQLKVDGEKIGDHEGRLRQIERK